MTEQSAAEVRPALSAPLPMPRGPALPHRVALAPLTNTQSNPDGTLSEDEHRWLTMRAQGGFALVMTCAAHVQAAGQGFPGQLGVFGDQHLEGLSRLASAVRAAGSVSSVQLHHAGDRSPAELVGQPVGASDDPDTGTRALTTAEVEQVVEDFAAAARRADTAGFDGVEVHGAHGYLLTQFLSPEKNRRTDRYGGSLENRARLLNEIVAAVRGACRADFQVGLRLSPERFGLRLAEVRAVAQDALDTGRVDYLDLSLWDVRKEPEEQEHRGRSLLACFVDLERHGIPVGVAGKIRTPAEVEEAIAAGADFVLVGRAAVLHHDLPQRALADPAFTPVPLPVTVEHLQREGLGTSFIEYMRGWKGFVA